MVMILGAGWFTYRQMGGDTHIPDTVFYTSDDGKTWYRESIKLDPPVMKEGKEGVVARVFSWWMARRRSPI
ncbi:MAG: hypothetical protein QM753_07565 [Thermomicrobiales bacterium]